jgi:hypothetical protein
MNLVRKLLHPTREADLVGYNVTLGRSVFLGVAVVYVHVTIAYVLQSERLYEIGSSDDELFVDVALKGVPS